MDTRITKKKRQALLIIAASIVVLAALVISTKATMAEDEEDDNSDRPEISIEVVEDIPASDIEEQRVPLADSPDTAAADSTRNTVAIWTLAAIVIAYAVFLFTGMRRRKARRLIRPGSEGDRGTEGGGSK